MGGPGWWTESLAAVVAAASVSCLGHLLFARRHPRRALDAVDVVMGGAMVAMLLGLPLARPVAWAALAAFGVVGIAATARPVVAVVRGGAAVVGGQPAVSCAAMVVMLVPLAVGGHHGMVGGSPALAVTAAVTTVALLAVGAADLVGFRRARGTRLVTGCRLAMSLAGVVMVVELIH